MVEACLASVEVRYFNILFSNVIFIIFLPFITQDSHLFQKGHIDKQRLKEGNAS